MIAALYSSKNSRTKAFQYEGVCFGWSVIEDLFARELRRINDRQPRRVPGLRESYVYRDIWTRLNVKPAKIMQVIITSQLVNICTSNLVISSLVTS